MTIRYNARKQRDAYEEEAKNTQKQANLVRMGAKGIKGASTGLAVGTSLLTGVSGVVNAYNKGK